MYVLSWRIKNLGSDRVLPVGVSFECGFLETHPLGSQWHYHEEIQNLGVRVTSLPLTSDMSLA